MPRILIIIILLFALLKPASAYSVLAHEAIIDSAWDRYIKVLLLKRFPNATPEDLVKAHAHAYGGSIIQDMGYYPFGSKLFTDLLHYVRSGDFIVRLIANSQDLNEYAFSLGALAHYAADNNGHPQATNRAVPLLYPKLRSAFGDRVTYADDAISHIRTEFAFDVVQVAQGHYAPNAYHEFIGFEVSRPLLERTFPEIYGLKMSDVFASVSLALGSYRRAVSSTIPAMTKAAWSMKKDQIMKDTPGATRQKFLYNISRSSYEKEWGKEYQKPGIKSKLIAFFLRILPIRATKFTTPTPEAEKLFMASFNTTLDRYRDLLAEQGAGRLKLPNENFDIGTPTVAGKYALADRTYARVLDKLDGHYDAMPPELRADILHFYADLNAPYATKKDAKEWAKVLRNLDRLKAAPAAAAQPQ